MTTPIDILRRIVATTPCTCAGWPHERCLICQASDALKVPILTPEEGRSSWNKLYGPEGERDPGTGVVRSVDPCPRVMAEQWCAGRTLGQGYQEGFEAGVKAERGRIKR